MPRLTTLCLALALTGCDRISDEMKKVACDRDGDSHLRDDDYCAGVDNGNPRDCDDNDANVSGKVTRYLDGDNDNFGGTVTQTACPADIESGYVESNGDCNDTDANISPNATEIACDLIDNDCDGVTDDAEEPIWYADLDGDDFGDPENTTNACDQPEGYITDNQDCDDADASVNPDATETCGDETDNDCNGIVDDAEGSIVWYADLDGDSYGDPENATAVCDTSIPDGHVDNDLDCDDTNASISPDAAEICGNEIDDNCNGVTDDDAETTTWWQDSDSDGYGNVDSTTEDCAPPEGYVGNDEDCDDTDGDIRPGATEVCKDGLDNNCSGDGDDCVLEGTIAASDADSRLLGTTDDQFIGQMLHSSDLDDDGSNDLMIGASDDDMLYLVFGSLSAGDSDIDDVSQPFEGDSGSYVGKSVSSGDLTNDGSTDLVLGSPGTDEIYLLEGPLSATGSTWTSSDADIVYTSEESGDWGGVSLASGGDMDGDGDCELVIGAYQNTNSDEQNNAGAVYVFKGPESSDEELGWANQIFEGGDSSVRLGHSMDGSQDLDGDGLVDLLIGGYEADSFTGVAYLIYGGSSASGTVSVDDYEDLTLTGENTGDYGGWAVAYTGDFDGTGNGTFAVSAYKEDSGGTDAGAAYLFLSAAGTSLGDADVKFTGESADDYAGFALSGDCDINGDGYDELIIGAFGDDDAGTDAGAAYLIYGTSSTLSSTFGLASADAKFTGVNAGDKAGMAVSCAEAGAYDNVVVGLPYWDNTTTSTTDSGLVLIFEGTTF